ncbi:hypothetical protein PABG_02761 [Paracoccidioides brasiliensis Pb03]|nr:hypothetical protein PABG_02761 [Paracoccidioides brasiliensis Pb03]
MSFLGSFCCFFPTRRQLPYSPTLHRQRYDPQAGFRHSRGAGGDVDAPGIDEPYLSMAPLPRYTPLPMSLHEKTLAFQHQHSDFPRFEKNPNEFERGLASSHFDDLSDASSVVSVPSSFGNTSTATTETPPPPYSPNSSRDPSRRSMSISVSTQGTGFTNASLESSDPQSLDIQLPLPPPSAIYRSHTADQFPETSREGYRRSLDEQINRSLSSLPPAYPRRE